MLKCSFCFCYIIEQLTAISSNRLQAYHLTPEQCSTLPSPGYSMWNPWKGGWTAQIPGGFHGMVDGIHGMGMDSILLVDGFHGMVDGFHGFSTWIPLVFQMDSIWNEFMES